MTAQQNRYANRQRLHKPLVILLITVSLGSFAIGYLTGNHRLKGQTYEAGQQQFREFLLNADRLGIIDHGRLDELTVTNGNARE